MCAAEHHVSFIYSRAGGPGCPQLKRGSLGSVTYSRANGVRFLSVIVLILSIAAIGSAMWLGLLQLGHIANTPRALTKAVLLGPFAPREAFTDRGWRYHRWGVAAALVGLVLFTMWAFTFGLG